MTTKASIAPGDRDIWVFDWTTWLARKTEEQGEAVTIASAEWTAGGDLDLLDSPAPSIFDSARQTRAWWDASDLSAGESASLTCTITTSAGHVRSATVVFDVRRR